MAKFDTELADLDVNPSELVDGDTVVVTQDVDAWIEEMLAGPETDEEDDYLY